MTLREPLRERAVQAAALALLLIMGLWTAARTSQGPVAAVLMVGFAYYVFTVVREKVVVDAHTVCVVKGLRTRCLQRRDIVAIEVFDDDRPRLVLAETAPYWKTSLSFGGDDAVRRLADELRVPILRAGKTIRRGSEHDGPHSG